MAFGWNRLSGGAGSLAAYLVALVPLSAGRIPKLAEVRKRLTA